MSAQNGPNNPAGRLLAVCRFFASMDNAVDMRAAWSQIVNVPQDNLPLLMLRVGVAMALVSSARRAIIEIPDINHELYLTWEKPVIDAFGRLNFVGKNISEIRARLAPEVLRSLEFCDHELSRRRPEPTLDPKQVAGFIDEIRKLIDDVLNSDLPQDLRSFILDKLYILEQSIQLYVFDGVKPIGEAIDSVIGATFRAGKEHSDRLQGTEYGSRFWSICAKIADAIAIFQSGFKLLESFSSMLR